MMIIESERRMNDESPLLMLPSDKIKRNSLDTSAFEENDFKVLKTSVVDMQTYMTHRKSIEHDIPEKSNSPINTASIIR